MEDRLVKFARIIDAGSFTKAASLLHISQPALTSAVKKLEKELQAELIVRSNKGLTLTSAGKIAYQTARNLIAEAQNLELQIRETTGEKPPLAIGMIDSLAHLLFITDTYLERLEQHARVSLVIDNSSRLAEAVNHNELDLALLAQPDRMQSGLTARTIGEEPLVLVAHQSLKNRTLQDLASRELHHFMSYNQASRTSQIITAHFAMLGVTVQPIFYSTSPEIILQLVLSKRGTAVLPYLLVRQHVDSGELTVIPTGTRRIRRRIVGLHRTKRAVSLQSEKLLEVTREHLTYLNEQVDSL
jgi:DNA-binding transcriptional LysR family regulator